MLTFVILKMRGGMFHETRAGWTLTTHLRSGRWLNVTEIIASHPRMALFLSHTSHPRMGLLHPIPGWDIPYIPSQDGIIYIPSQDGISHTKKKYFMDSTSQDGQYYFHPRMGHPIPRKNISIHRWDIPSWDGKYGMSQRWLKVPKGEYWIEHGRSAHTNSSYSTCIASGVLRHLFLNSTNSAVAHFGEGTTTASATELGELSLFLKRRSKI